MTAKEPPPPMMPSQRRGGLLPADVPASQRPRSRSAWQAVLAALSAQPRRVLLRVDRRERPPEQRVYGLWLEDGSVIPLAHLGYDDEGGFHDLRLRTE